MSVEHPFTVHLRTIGRGPNLSRPLTEAEADAAMRMILAGDVLPAQLGAFLLVLRYRGETAPELAGFVRAARDAMRLDGGPERVDLDWPSYADRHRQQPWFVLAALLLAENRVKVLMHGIEGAGGGYAPTRPVLARLGVRVCTTAADARSALAASNFAYLGLEHFCTPLHALFDLRPLLGVRTVVNTLARALNPFEAPHQLQGVFHPPYRRLHQRAAILLNQPRAAIFTGGGGEAQRNPLKPCKVAFVRDGVETESEWPALRSDLAYRWREEDLDPAAVAALWRGDRSAPAPEAAITGTVALALYLTGRADAAESAQAMADATWRDRPRAKYATAA